jgi:hypothetical protein
MKKQTRAEKAAEKYFETWWGSKDRYHASFQIELAKAFEAGAKWARRDAIAALMIAQEIKCRADAIDAIKKRSRS